jgi:hypothetical protein
MTYRVTGALIASLSAVTLLLSANQTFARSGGAPHGLLAAPAPATARAPIASAPRFRNARNPFVYWPGGGGFFYDGLSGAESYAGVAQPLSNDVPYTYDVPWDWAHRYPPNVVPSDKPYVSSCPSETVTVPGRGGQEQTVNIMRCY